MCFAPPGHHHLHFFNVSTCKMCVAQHRRACFQPLNFQNCFVHLDFKICFGPQPRANACILYQFLISHLPRSLRTRHFSERTFGPSRAPKHSENNVSGLSIPIFAQFFSLLFDFSSADSFLWFFPFIVGSLAFSYSKKLAARGRNLNSNQANTSLACSKPSYFSQVATHGLRRRRWVPDYIHDHSWLYLSMYTGTKPSGRSKQKKKTTIISTCVCVSVWVCVCLRLGSGLNCLTFPGNLRHDPVLDRRRSKQLPSWWKRSRQGHSV